jgi:HNH endonuclease
MGDNPMDTRLLDQFDKELEVEYRGETYRVRDNGSVCRQRKSNERKRPLDGIWTFGWVNASTGYMQIGNEVVHRIVATAFHGEQPSEKHIVDHIDTNRRNNRAENLRWITRLDNLLQNPITLRRIITAFGSLDEFLKITVQTGISAITKHAWLDRERFRFAWLPALRGDRATAYLFADFLAVGEMNMLPLSRRDHSATEYYAPGERTPAEEAFAGKEEINVLAPLLFAVIGIVLTIGLIKDGEPVDHTALYGAIGCFAVAFLVRYLSPAAMLKRRMRAATKAVPLRYRIMFWTGLLLCVAAFAWGPSAVAGFLLFPFFVLLNVIVLD